MPHKLSWLGVLRHRRCFINVYFLVNEWYDCRIVKDADDEQCLHLVT